MLISLVGLPYSGKKEIARWLVAERGFQRVSLKLVRSCLCFPRLGGRQSSFVTMRPPSASCTRS